MIALLTTLVLATGSTVAVQSGGHQFVERDSGTPLENGLGVSIIGSLEWPMTGALSLVGQCEWTSASREMAGGGTASRTLLGAGSAFRLRKEVGRSSDLYVQSGASLLFTEVERDRPGSLDDAQSQGINVAVHAAGGVEAAMSRTSSAFAETRATAAATGDWNGLGVYIGVRFAR